MSAHDLLARIERFNAGREPERLAFKYQKMRASAFAFFRGTAHLFWEDLASQRKALPSSPLVWACGDLHLENFGSYQGDDGLAYFDLNDFDEAALAPALWEVARFVTCVHVAAPELGVADSDADELVGVYLDAYRAALIDGKARWIERSTATGLVRKLLRRAGKQTNAALLDSHTVVNKGKRRIVVDGKHALPITNAQRQAVTRELQRFAKSQQNPGFFKVIDVARRAAGLGSLGLARYILLVRGEGGANGNALLDAKEATRSSLAMFEDRAQPKWRSEANRVVDIQRRMQAIAPALLHSSPIGRGGYVLRELQPSADRLSLKDTRGDVRQMHSVAKSMGRLTAWAQLRSTGRQGSTTTDDLIEFAGVRGWQRRLQEYGRRYAKDVRRDYKEFVAAKNDEAAAQGD